MTSERNHWKQTNFSVKILAPIFLQKQLTGAQCYSQMWSCRLQFASFHQTCCLIKDLLHLSRSPICSLSACGFETSFKKKKKKNHHWGPIVNRGESVHTWFAAWMTPIALSASLNINLQTVLYSTLCSYQSWCNAWTIYCVLFAFIYEKFSKLLFTFLFFSWARIYSVIWFAHEISRHLGKN